MKMKHLIVLAPLLVIVALVAVPTAAQAAGARWTKNGTVLANGKPEPTISWGTLSLESAAGNISCKNAVAGNVENTSAEPQNRSATSLFAPYECKNSGGECPLVAGTETVVPEGLPWGWTTEEEEIGDELYRAKGFSIRVNIICSAGGKEAGHLIFETGKVEETEGTSTPAWLNGATAGRPSEVSFDAESGHLASSAEVEFDVDGFTPFQTEAEATAGSATIKATELAKKGADIGDVVNGVFIKTDGNKPPANLTVISSVNETEATLMEVEFNGTEYVPHAEGKATLTGKFPVGVNPGSGKTKKTTILGTTKGKMKVEGYEGTPLPIVGVVPGVPGPPKPQIKLVEEHGKVAPCHFPTGTPATSCSVEVKNRGNVNVKLINEKINGGANPGFHFEAEGTCNNQELGIGGACIATVQYNGPNGAVVGANKATYEVQGEEVGGTNQKTPVESLALENK